MSNTTVIGRPGRLDDADIADLFNLDTRHETVPAVLSGFGKSANCTNDGCTATCVCGPGRTTR